MNRKLDPYPCTSHWGNGGIMDYVVYEYNPYYVQMSYVS